ncbi:MAG: TRAP transporter substrate-binding protein [Gammaproteobacteria bacterium]|nr:TRAP transporter substrate-binding protein [Gammaproteobacteria bacterium]MDH3505658.1 TRAP transporter substrate-binding protein [Gammaproteobacteria bacterium]
MMNLSRNLSACLILLIGACADPQSPEASLEQAPETPSAAAEQQPIVIRLGGYGPDTTSFSQGMRLIGERLTEQLGDRVDVRYVLNVLDIGYGGADLSWLVDAGLLTMAYATMSEDRVPELDLVALPFIFEDTAAARAAMDGPLGQAVANGIEAKRDVRVLGFFENGFRHVSNNVRPVRSPADFAGVSIRVLQTQLRTFELLGADGKYLPLPQVREGLASGTLDGQENPFANAVTYNLYPLQRYYTATYHSYLSRAIFVHRPSFESWPPDVQTVLRDAVREAVALQRSLKDDEELQAAETIRASGGEIIELTPAERQLFIDAVTPIYDEARAGFSPELIDLIGL